MLAGVVFIGAACRGVLATVRADADRVENKSTDEDVAYFRLIRDMP